MFCSFAAAPQRSIASDSARRTRSSLNGARLVLKDDQKGRQPGALADLDAVAQRLDELVALNRGDAAELGRDMAGLVARHHRRSGHKIGTVAVEIRFARLEILVPAHAAPELALDMLGKDERSGAENVGLGKLGILGELGGAVDAVPRRGEVRQHRRLRPLQMEHDGARVGRVDARDRRVIDLARRNDSGGWVDDALVARLHVGRGQLRAVVKEDVGPQLEGIGEPVGRHIPRFRQDRRRSAGNWARRI